MIKSQEDALCVGDLRQWWHALALQPLSFRPEHVSTIYDLRPIHQDPFDRASVAQMIAEDPNRVATERLIAQYACEHLR